MIGKQECSVWTRVKIVKLEMFECMKNEKRKYMKRNTNVIAPLPSSIETDKFSKDCT